MWSLIIMLLAVFITVMELAHNAIYGKPNTKIANMFCDKHLDDYVFNKYDYSILSNLGDTPYISKSFSLFSKWYISGVCSVPRWSRAHKMIEKKYKELLTM